VSVPVTLSDLERRDVRGQIFLAAIYNYARVVSPRMTEFGMVTQVKEKHVYKGLPRILSQGPTTMPKCATHLA